MTTSDTHPPSTPPAAWYHLRVGQKTGYVILSRPTGHPPTADDPGAYWCGHADWDAFVNCLEYPDLHTRQMRAAAVAVYPTAWDAVRSWHTWLADRHRRHGRPYPAAFELVPLSSLSDRTTVPLWQHRHPVSTTEAAAIRRAHSAPPGERIQQAPAVRPGRMTAPRRDRPGHPYWSQGWPRGVAGSGSTGHYQAACMSTARRSANSA